MIYLWLVKVVCSRPFIPQIKVWLTSRSILETRGNRVIAPEQLCSDIVVFDFFSRVTSAAFIYNKKNVKQINCQTGTKQRKIFTLWLEKRTCCWLVLDGPGPGVPQLVYVPCSRHSRLGGLPPADRIGVIESHPRGNSTSPTHPSLAGGVFHEGWGPASRTWGN